MDAVFLFVNSVLGGLISWFGTDRPAAALVIFSVAAGAVLTWTLRALSDQAALRETKRRLLATLFEFRLFQDEPAILWRAQKNLVRLNVRYLRLLLPPLLVSTVPMAAFLAQVGMFYGRRALRVGEAAVVTVQLKKPLDPASPVPRLRKVKGLAVETPAVRLFDENQISWRIRGLERVSGSLQLEAGGELIQKTVEVADCGLAVVPLRSASHWDWLRYPGEARLRSDTVAWVAVDYPGATVEILGWEFHWLVWFSALTVLTALLCKRPMRVVF